MVPWLAVWLAIWLGAYGGIVDGGLVRTELLKIRTAEGPALTNRYALVVYATTMAVIVLLVTVVLNQPAPGIVYKAF